MPRDTKHLCHVFKEEYGSEKTVEELYFGPDFLIFEFIHRVMGSNIVLNKDPLINAQTLHDLLYMTSVVVYEPVFKWLVDAGVKVFLNTDRKLLLEEHMNTDHSHVHCWSRKRRDYFIYLDEQEKKLLEGATDKSGEVDQAEDLEEEEEIASESGDQVFSPVPSWNSPPSSNSSPMWK